MLVGQGWINNNVDAMDCWKGKDETQIQAETEVS